MLQIRGLEVAYLHDDQRWLAVRGVDLDVPTGAAVALVGESGSGKSTIALSVMRLIGPPIGEVASGSVMLDGVDLLTLDQKAMRRVLHEDIGYVPQDPTSALDPLCTIGRHIDETLPANVHGSERPRAIAALLTSLGVAQAAERLGNYPHEFSGGMKQRVAIATALARGPKLLIADEPTTALDVTTQLVILRLIDRLRRERDLALLFVTHDLSVARMLCQQVVVLYAGKVMERGPVEEVIARPRHPYTRALIDAIPAMAAPRARLRAIPGQPPTPANVGIGCPFSARCPLAIAKCHEYAPPLEDYDGVKAACWRVGEMVTAG